MLKTAMRTFLRLASSEIYELLSDGRDLGELSLSTHFNQNFKFNDFSEGLKERRKKKTFSICKWKKSFRMKPHEKNSNLQQHAFSFSPSTVL